MANQYLSSGQKIDFHALQKILFFPHFFALLNTFIGCQNEFEWVLSKSRVEIILH